MYQKKFRVSCISAAIVLLGAAFFSMPTAADAEVKKYHTYHFNASRVITECDMGVDFMEKYFPLWVYDGEREWSVGRIVVGIFTKYEIDGCILYTNSLSMKVVLNFLGIPRISGYNCIEHDVEYAEAEAEAEGEVEAEESASAE